MKLNTLLLLSAVTALTVFHSCSGQNTSVTPGPSPTASPGDTVTKLSRSLPIVFQAANGDYWFGSDTDGVYRYDGKTILHFSESDGLSSNCIRSIQEDQQGNIYFSTMGGIDKFDGHVFTQLLPVKSSYPGENWKLQAGDLWFNIPGKEGVNGPCRYDGKTLYQLEFPRHFLADAYYANHPNNAWSPYDVYYIYKDSKGTMWFGTSNFGICRYDGRTLCWLYEDQLTNTPEGGSFGIRSIIEDKKGKYWFCNTRYRYNISPDSTIKNGNVFVEYKKEKGIDGLETAGGADHIYFLSVITDDKGDLWMATYREGVWRYDGKKVTHYPVKDGTKDITVFTIYKDRQGRLWLGTHETGAYLFNGQAFEKFEPR